MTGSHGHSWDPAAYAAHASFVPALGAPALELLAPKRGERILDLGCGDGALTAKLVEAGADRREHVAPVGLGEREIAHSGHSGLRAANRIRT